VICRALQKDAGSSPHGQPAVANLLELIVLDRGCVLAHGLETKVTGCAITALPACGDSVSRDKLYDAEEEEAGEEGAGVLLHDVPEEVDLVLASGEAREDNSELASDGTDDGKHGNSGVLELSLAHPVEVNAKVVDVGEAEGIKAFISCHGAVELGRSHEERERLGALGHHGEGGGARRGAGSGCKGGSHGQEASENDGAEPDYK